VCSGGGLKSWLNQLAGADRGVALSAMVSPKRPVNIARGKRLTGSAYAKRKSKGWHRPKLPGLGGHSCIVHPLSNAALPRLTASDCSGCAKVNAPASVFNAGRNNVAINWPARFRI
jgi:hypothetical protein